MIETIKPTGGWKANSYIIFDYVSERDFKFAGLDLAISKLVMGHRDATGWHVDKQGSVPGGVKSDTWYNMLVAVNGTNVTLVVNNSQVFTHTFQPRMATGFEYLIVRLATPQLDNEPAIEIVDRIGDWTLYRWTHKATENLEP